MSTSSASFTGIHRLGQVEYDAYDVPLERLGTEKLNQLINVTQDRLSKVSSKEQQSIRRIIFRLLRSKTILNPTLEELDRAINIGEEIVDKTPSKKSQAEPDILNDIGYMRATRYEFSKQVNDLNLAVDFGKRAVSASDAMDRSKASRLDNLGYSLSARYSVTGSKEDLEESIQVAKQALELTPPEGEMQFKFMTNLCARLVKRYQETYDRQNLDDALKLGYEATNLTDVQFPERGALFHNLSTLLLLDFNRTGFRGDFEKALRMGRLAMQSKWGKEKGGSAMNWAMATLMHRRYELLKNIDDLMEAIGLVDKAISAAPGQVSAPLYRSAWLKNRALWLKEAYERLDTLEVLERAVAAFTDGLKETSDKQGTLYGFYLDELASLFTIMFFRRRYLVDWICLLKNVIQLIWWHIEMTQTAEDLGKVCSRMETYLKLSKQVEAFESRLSAITGQVLDPLTQKMLESISAEYGKRKDTMNPVDALTEVVSGCVDFRFDVYGDNLDAVQKLCDECFKHGASFGLTSIRPRFRMLEIGVQFEEEPPETMPGLRATMETQRSFLDRVRDGAERIGILEKLTETALKINERSPDRESLAEAIYRAESLVEAYEHEAIGERKNYPHWLASLAELLRIRFKETLHVQDLDRSFELAEKALALTEKSDKSSLYYTLALVLKSRYQTRGDGADLEKAIKLAEDAMEGTMDSKLKKSMLFNYGLMLRLSYQRTHAISDLDKAYAAVEEAIQELSHTRISGLVNLCSIMYDRYERTCAVEDIEKAVALGREALTSYTSSAEVERPKGLNGPVISANLGLALLGYYNATGNRMHLDDAIMHSAEAAANPVPGYSAGLAPNNFAEMLIERGRLDDRVEDFDQAILHAQRSVDLTPKNHSHRARYIRVLGLALAAKMECAPSNNLVDRCVEAFVEAWEQDTSEPGQRLSAALLAAKFLLQDQQFERAADILARTVSMLPKIGNRWVPKSDYQHWLSESFTGVGADAALAALQVGRDPAEALQLIEYGRGIMMGMIMENRMEISSASPEHSDLLRKFNLLRLEVDSMSDEKSLEFPSVGGSTLRRKVNEMEEVLKEIRNLPGKVQFLLPPSVQDLMQLALDGPIVIVTTSSIVARSAALILTSSGVSWVALPALKHGDVSTRVAKLTKALEALGNDVQAANCTLKNTLSWLWKVAVEPILTELGYTADVSTHLPKDMAHVKWIGVGLLGRLPFHAAGDYSVNSNSNAMCRVVSSYLTTVRALAYGSRRNEAKRVRGKLDANLLVVLMPQTPGLDELPYVKNEAEMIAGITGASGLNSSSLEQPSVDTILKELPLHRLVHFACHGVSNYADPSQSHLVLNDGELTISQILKSHVAEPEVAFLSACSTAESGNAMLADESIHIASSFQQIGFRHVVGTLWSSDDETCSKVSEVFYWELLADSETHDDWNGEWKVADALHLAIKSVRDRHPDFPLVWAPYVVFGG